jgi:hypothetical protein
MRAFGTPRLLHLDRGPVIYQPGWGLGDGRVQYQYDEYWLWQDETWVRLDVWSWAGTRSFDRHLPQGIHLDGVLKSGFSLPGMRYVGDLTRDGDCHTCATGGHVNVDFEWDDLVLRVRDVEYLPPLRRLSRQL